MANISFGLDTDKYAKERGFDKYQTTIGEVLGETAKDAWKYNPVSSLIRLSELETNRSENTGEPLIDRQELNDKYGKFNLFFDEDEKNEEPLEKKDFLAEFFQELEEEDKQEAT